MAVRTSTASWQGDLKGGGGSVALGSGAFEGRYSFASRFEEGPGTNPEELIGAAHAGCFSMFLANLLASAGFTPERVDTEAKVHLGKDDAGAAIVKIELHTRASVPGVDGATFEKLVHDAKVGCPVSKALKAVPLEVDARLV